MSVPPGVAWSKSAALPTSFECDSLTRFHLISSKASYPIDLTIGPYRWTTNPDIDA